ncbi:MULTISPECIES: hypothetical protein [Staphylococcus]|uniref:Uncharacterized protein n=1 Tax=Staphylococcus hsinchuensis TaxID=3051183 RepID=A0ABZ3ECK5_9STAP|nr:MULTISPECIES: hypothetical protein [unclassified Staphylococcus]
MDKDNKRPLTLHEKWIIDGEIISKLEPGKYDKELTKEEIQAFADELEQLKRDREKKGYK